MSEDIASGVGVGGGRRQPHRLAEGRLCCTVPEAAQLLGVSRNQGYELARRGEIPVIKFGCRIRLPKARLYKMLGQGIDSEGVR